MLLPLLLNLSCNNFVETPMYENYLWTCCNMWLVVLNHVWCWFVHQFAWDPSWFHRTTGFIWVPSMTVRSLRWLLLYLCSYKLDGSVTIPFPSWLLTWLLNEVAGGGEVGIESPNSDFAAAVVAGGWPPRVLLLPAIVCDQVMYLRWQQLSP